MEDNNSSNKKQKIEKTQKGKKIFKITAFIFLFLILTVFVVGSGYLYALIKSTPQLDVNAVLSLNQQSQIFDNKEQFMDNVQTDEQRFVIPLSEMPQPLQDGIVSIEDERFFFHKGVDVRRILGVVYIDAKNKLTGQGGLQGASTLTQQLLRNTVLTNEVTFERKIKEIYLAIKLEESLDKKQILEAYLNTIPLGGHVYGVEAASLQYFGIHTKDLNLIQSAYLAGVTQSPTLYNALTEQSKKNPEPYINRTKSVLTKMLQNNKITQAQYDKAIADINAGKLTQSFKPVKKTERMNYEWFSRPVIQQVIKDLMNRYKYTREEAIKIVTNGGLKIYTTMDRSLQEYTQAVLDNPSNFNLSNNKNEMIEDKGYKYPALQASATIIDYRTGEVKAMVGGRGNQPPSSTNRAYATRGLRSVGSATKPLTVYGPAIDTKKMTAATVINDSPVPFETGKKYGSSSAPYNPKNQDGSYRGPVTLREALRYSLNVVAVKIEDEIGLKTGLAYGEKFGLKYNKNSRQSIATLSLGQFNNPGNDANGDGGNTFILSAAYGTFGNSGIYTEPILYTKVLDATGKPLLESKPETKKILSPQSAYVMYDVLKEPVLNYTAKPAKFGDIPVAGKTGTTSDNKDLWFAGLTPYLSASVWVGYDNPKELYGQSGYTVTPIWGKIMAKAHEGLGYKEIAEPAGVVKVAVCNDSGKLATDFCGGRIHQELFIEGTVPTALCNIHTAPKENKTNEDKTNEDTTTPDDNKSTPLEAKPGDANKNKTNNNNSPAKGTNNNGNTTNSKKSNTSTTTNNNTTNSTTTNSTNTTTQSTNDKKGTTKN
ncbi:penicillin-binding protein 1A [Clostridium polyendosporum]|uniref:Penicillin-binding protein 1A n=1 Tax=Clostridium polyendosporum TaxID=69208 RepID=A0A919RZR9_9CLOT|nr:PBP1A family penicillin-binding protein [Clostridium polyendosporum]GIM28618.1 penicillin-binding protein 1A [Clostridium polyendosporum]